MSSIRATLTTLMKHDPDLAVEYLRGLPDATLDDLAGDLLSDGFEISQAIRSGDRSRSLRRAEARIHRELAAVREVQLDRLEGELGELNEDYFEGLAARLDVGR